MLKLSVKRKVVIVFFVGLALTLSSFLYCYPHMRAEGRSMEPTIYNGSLTILDKNISDKNLTCQIIVFEPDWGEVRILHRVEYDFGEILITKGDNNDYSDIYIHRQDIFGVVIAYSPFGWLFFVEVFTIFTSIGVVILIVTISYIKEKGKLP